jgi:hypothetical protein
MTGILVPEVDWLVIVVIIFFEEGLGFSSVSGVSVGSKLLEEELSDSGTRELIDEVWRDSD